MDERMLQLLSDRLQEIEAQLATRTDEDSQAAASPHLWVQLAEHYRAVLEDLNTSGAVASRKQISGRELRDEMERILEAADKPLPYRVIYERLQERGFSVGGRDPIRNTAAHLSSDRRFVSRGGGGWELSRWPTSREKAAAHRSTLNMQQPMDNR